MDTKPGQIDSDDMLRMFGDTVDVYAEHMLPSMVRIANETFSSG